MSLYANTCGQFEINVWDGGHPIWVELKVDGADIRGHIRSDDLYDLKHLIDRAIVAIEAKERELERRRGS